MNSLQIVATIVGVGLVVFPEPATTATGLAILAANLGYVAYTRPSAPAKSKK
jgi:hypothetical protein